MFLEKMGNFFLDRLRCQHDTETYELLVVAYANVDYSFEMVDVDGKDLPEYKP